MSEGTDMSRRSFLRTAGGTTAAAVTATAASGTAAAQEIDYGGWFDDVGNYDGTTDATGQGEVTVSVGAEGNGGAFAFDPPAIQVDPGTTVVWEWTGAGGQHNVVSEDGDDFQSDLVSEAGFTFEHTFEEDGITTYYCEPHLSLGMKGAVAVGDVATSGGGEGGGGAPRPTVPDSAMSLGVATTFAMIATLGLAYFFLKYGGDYEMPE